MLGSTILHAALAMASGSLPVSDPSARPYGNVMGDGLRAGGCPDASASDDLGAQLDPIAAVCAPGTTLFGIDVSYYQGTIDWNAVAADGVEFAIVRVSHSTSFFDPQFDANLAGARAAGIHTGVYQYFQPDEDPIAQAQLLLDHLGPLQPGDLPPMIDVETTGGVGPAGVASAVAAWLDHVEAALGVKPLIYTGHYFWQDNVGSSDFGEYPLVVAWYGVDCPGNIPTGWDMWTIHQYGDNGNVSGISGNVDVDRFNGDEAALSGLSFAPVCGDAMCTGAENEFTCASDCPPCGIVPAGGVVMDNDHACYELYGDAQYWHTEAVGNGGSLVWTHATDYDKDYNYATWTFDFAESGRYALDVYIQQPFGASKSASYHVRHAGGEMAVVVDQSQGNGWVSLGEFQFTAATDHGLRLGDATGESPDANVQLVFDAVRLTRLDGGGDSSGGGDAGGDGTAAGDDGSDGGIGDGTDGAPAPGSSDDGVGVGTDGFGQDDSGSDGGCGCTSDAAPRGLAPLAVLLVLARRRRR